MRSIPSLIVAGLFAAGQGAPAARAQVAYQLETGSSLTLVSCPDPCPCPPSQVGGPASGGFTLTFDHSAGSYNYYNVLAVAWVVNLNGTPTPVVGSGTYVLTAPIAFLHQMQLDLAVGGDIPRHYDSGLVSASVHNLFPSIGIELSTEVFDCNRNDLRVIARPSPPPPCYANCDNSTATPALNVADFTCFLQKYANGDAYANCDSSTSPPTLNVADFTCFLQKYANGCP